MRYKVKETNLSKLKKYITRTLKVEVKEKTKDNEQS